VPGGSRIPTRKNVWIGDYFGSRLTNLGIFWKRGLEGKNGDIVRGRNKSMKEWIERARRRTSRKIRSWK
jgi:hypothetical protein